MINVSQMHKQLMRKNKKELLKLLKESGKQANQYLQQLKKSGDWEYMPIQTRNVAKNWMNRGWFPKTAKVKTTKEQLTMMIIHNRAFLEFEPLKRKLDESEENNGGFDDDGRKNWQKMYGKIPDKLADIADNFMRWYDPSEFWSTYYTRFRDKMSESDYWEYGIKLASECEKREEFYTKLRTGGSEWL